MFGLSIRIRFCINNYNSVRTFPHMSVHMTLEYILCDIDKYNSFISTCYLTYALNNLVQLELDKIVSKMKADIVIEGNYGYIYTHKY